MSAIKRMGVLYKKLGLATEPSLIEARAAGVVAASEAMGVSEVPELLRYVFGLARDTKEPSFFAHFSEQDPTFDVQPGDKEASLLASSIVAYELEQKTSVSGTLALCIVTASLGGVRRPITDDQLLGLAELSLVNAQGESNKAPSKRTYHAQPNDLTAAFEEVEQLNGSLYFNSAKPSVLKSFQLLGKYAESNSLASAKNDNIILTYIQGLEEELRTYWWVTGGWSSDAGKAFRHLPVLEAALRAGKELVDKNSASLGLFAAPALLSLVIENGRQTNSEKMSLIEAATTMDLDWRTEIFGKIATGSFADLLPVTTAQGYAAESEDAPDWQPRFKRLTGIDPAVEIPPLDLSLQIYRERLTFRALSS